MIAEALCVLLEGTGWLIVTVSLAGILYELTKGVKK
jgi:hypothetical protein